MNATIELASVNAAPSVWDALDYPALQRAAWHYCRTVDATRSRKRADESADDVAQDAALLLSGNLSRATTWQAVEGPAREGARTLWGAFARIYVTRDGRELAVTYGTLQRWAVTNAARSNGYRVDMPEQERDMSAEAASVDHRHANRVAPLSARDGFITPDQDKAREYAPAVSGTADLIWTAVYGDGSDYPALASLLAASEGATRVDSIPDRAARMAGTGKRNQRRTDALKADALRELSTLQGELAAYRDAVATIRA